MYYTLGTAAKAAGVAKSTLSKAIKNGELSYVDKVKNSYRIEPSELDRWKTFFIKRSSPNDNGHSITPDSSTKNSALEREIELLREMAGKMEKAQEERINSLIEERDQWREEAKANRRLLEDHSRKNNRGFMARFFGKSDTAA